MLKCCPSLNVCSRNVTCVQHAWLDSHVSNVMELLLKLSKKLQFNSQQSQTIRQVDRTIYNTISWQTFLQHTLIQRRTATGGSNVQWLELVPSPSQHPYHRKASQSTQNASSCFLLAKEQFSLDKNNKKGSLLVLTTTPKQPCWLVTNVNDVKHLGVSHGCTANKLYHVSIATKIQ